MTVILIETVQAVCSRKESRPCIAETKFNSRSHGYLGELVWRNLQRYPSVDEKKKIAQECSKKRKNLVFERWR
jgi:hypothetical protein